MCRQDVRKALILFLFVLAPGVSGNVILPAVGKVLTGTQYGVSGTGSTGTLTLPSANNVLSGSGTYGDPTPTLWAVSLSGTAGRVISYRGFLGQPHD